MLMSYKINQDLVIGNTGKKLSDVLNDITNINNTLNNINNTLNTINSNLQFKDITSKVKLVGSDYTQSSGFFKVLQFGKVVWIIDYLQVNNEGSYGNTYYSGLPRISTMGHWQLPRWEYPSNTDTTPLVIYESNQGTQLKIRNGIKSAYYFVNLMYLTDE